MCVQVATPLNEETTGKNNDDFTDNALRHLFLAFFSRPCDLSLSGSTFDYSVATAAVHARVLRSCHATHKPFCSKDWTFGTNPFRLYNTDNWSIQMALVESVLASVNGII